MDIPKNNFYRKRLGETGENIGEKYLLKKGYYLLEKNYRCRSGEIDLLFMDGETLVAVEVKSRKSTEYGLPCESITYKKIRHLVNCLYAYVLSNNIKKLNMRIDVLEVFLDENNKVADINHIVNAV